MIWYVRIRRGHRNSFYRLEMPEETEPLAALQSAYAEGRPVSEQEYQRAAVLTTTRTYIGPHCVTRMPEEPEAETTTEAPAAVQLDLLGAS